MDSRTEHRGACLCGAVGVIAKPKTDKVVVCHCKMCRQGGGGPMFAAECEQAVIFQGDAQYPVIVAEFNWVLFEADPATGRIDVQFIGDGGDVLDAMTLQV